ncbi:MAG: trans-aconitate 2-methyltransferase [Burkholderiales bacterium]
MLLDSQTTRFYEDHVRRFGFTFRALGLGRRSSQEKRFAAANALGAFHGKRLLDVGCGFGDLLAWLRARGIEPDYTGLDICKSMIERCRKRFRRSARFLIGDALSFVTDDPYDYIVASGIFGYNAKDTRKRLQPTLERLFDLTRVGLAVNFLSRRAPTRSPGRLYLHPADVLQFALKLTPAVRLDHSYLPNDFTVCLYRTPPWE